MKRLLLLTLILLTLTACAQTEAGSTTANTPIQATPTLTPSPQLTPTPVPYYLENGSLFVLNQTNDEYLEVDIEVDEISMVDGVVTAKDSNGTELFVYFIGEVETWGETDTKPLVLKSPLIMPDGRQVYGTFFNFDEGIWDIVPELAVANGMALVGDQAYGYDYETGDLSLVNLDGVIRYEMVDWVLTGFNAQGEVMVTYDNETMSWVNMEIRPISENIRVYCGEGKNHVVSDNFVYNVYDETYERITNFSMDDYRNDGIGSRSESFKYDLWRHGLDSAFIEKLDYDLSWHDTCCFSLLAVSDDGKAALFELYGDHTQENNEEIVYWASINQPQVKRIMKADFNPWTVTMGETFANNKLLANNIVFDVTNGSYVQFTDKNSYSSKISPDGSKAGLYGNQEITIFDIPSKSEIMKFSIKNFVFDFAPDSDHFIYYNPETDQIMIGSISSDEEIELTYFSQLIDAGNRIKHIDFSPDGQWIIYWLGDEKAYTWHAFNINSQKSIQFENFELTYKRIGPSEWTINYLYGFSWSPDGKWFIGEDTFEYYASSALHYSSFHYHVCSIETFSCNDYLVAPEYNYDEKYICGSAVWEK